MESRQNTEIRDRYLRTLDRIARAARSVGRDEDEVRLVVVTKAHPVELIQIVLEAGARRLGENYPEQAVPKIEVVSHEWAVEWHMIGHVQSRKAKLVARHFDWLQSLDSYKLAARLNRLADQAERTLPVLLEVNVSGEATKYGWPVWDNRSWPGLADDVERILELPNLEVRGLMTVPPIMTDEEETRRYFRRARALQEYLDRTVSGGSWKELSMGMSSDFEIAIQEGATIVRIGQAILGPRT